MEDSANIFKTGTPKHTDNPDTCPECQKHGIGEVVKMAVEYPFMVLLAAIFAHNLSKKG